MPSPLPFPASGVPLVGQPVHVLGYTVLVMAHCQCGKALPMQLMAQATVQGLAGVAAGCAACGTIYAVQGVQLIDGQLQFTLAMQRPQTVSS